MAYLSMQLQLNVVSGSFDGSDVVMRLGYKVGLDSCPGR
jgi:hypothetical protein